MKNWYNSQARDIWTRHAAAHAALPGMSLVPMQRPEFVLEPELLFVGMNPSFASRLKKCPMRYRFVWRPVFTDEELSELEAHEHMSRQNYAVYFRPLERFAHDVGVDAKQVEHLDLLPLRHTSQAEVVSSYWGKAGRAHVVVEECFALFEEALLRLKPQIVVVANAEASRKIRDRLDLATRDGGRSHYWTEMEETTLFLSGMLTGQRALDEFSRARLAAEVRDQVRQRRAHHPQCAHTSFQVLSA
ncbi:hypothetical protein V9K97_18370 [Variovorax sp. CCNWLW186]|uniref:hypothetical protein n=1 Tax=Variovorax sp. CCNWLW186 TaxID=3127473 RepID=UPI0030781332